MSARFIVADVFEGLASLPDNSIDLVLSSPPFLALRSYLPADHPDKALEIGSEATPAEFLDTLLDVVEACDRVLAPHGSLCFELGDTFAGSGGAGGDYNEGGLREGQAKFRQGTPRWDGRPEGQIRTTTSDPVSYPARARDGWPLDKSLTGIPTLFAWSLAYGRNLLRPERTTPPWRIRNVVAWCRPNPPVGALGDKFRCATSYLTVATKSRTRWFDLDAVRGPASENTHARTAKGIESRSSTGKSADDALHETAGAPPLDYWEIPTQPFKGSHYATFPEALCTRPIESMCPREVCRTCGEPRRRMVEKSPEYAAIRAAVGRFGTAEQHETGMAGGNRSQEMGAMTAAEYVTTGWTDCSHDDFRPGVVLDPFAGSGTVLQVATGHGRDAVGIDLDERNADLCRERVGMFLTVETLAPEVVPA